MKQMGSCNNASAENTVQDGARRARFGDAGLALRTPLGTHRTVVGSRRAYLFGVPPNQLVRAIAFPIERRDGLFRTTVIWGCAFCHGVASCGDVGQPVLEPVLHRLPLMHCGARSRLRRGDDDTADFANAHALFHDGMVSPAAAAFPVEIASL
jgi:hypothetical protein